MAPSTLAKVTRDITCQAIKRFFLFSPLKLSELLLLYIHKHIYMKVLKKPDMSNWSEERKKTFQCLAVEERLTLKDLDKNLTNATVTLNKNGELVFKRNK